MTGVPFDIIGHPDIGKLRLGVGCPGVIVLFESKVLEIHWPEPVAAGRHVNDLRWKVWCRRAQQGICE